jgi:hypothetical protein
MVVPTVNNNAGVFIPLFTQVLNARVKFTELNELLPIIILLAVSSMFDHPPVGGLRELPGRS